MYTSAEGVLDVAQPVPPSYDTAECSRMYLLDAANSRAISLVQGKVLIGLCISLRFMAGLQGLVGPLEQEEEPRGSVFLKRLRAL